MRKYPILNPFVVGKYVSEEYFCDREQETEFLVKQVMNGRNVALISPRRMGKTGLIEHCFNREDVKQNYYLFFADIYSTSSLSEMVYLLGKAIYAQLKPLKTVWSENFFKAVSSLRIGFKLDPFTGEPGFDIGLGDISAPETTLDEIFRYLESADRPCVVAIDEFQQINSYRENNVEALLRGYIQRCKQTSFVFCGSKRHVMSRMFNSPAKPFYQSSINMSLDPIPLDKYVEFAVRLFKMYNKDIDVNVIEEVYARMEGCTWFIQMLMNELFALTAEGEKCTFEMIPAAWENIIMVQEQAYKEQFSLLPPKQKHLLLSIAKEIVAEKITSAAFIKKHNLQSASSIQAALKPLLENDIVIKTDAGYRIYDYFYAEWLRNF